MSGSGSGGYYIPPYRRSEDLVCSKINIDTVLVDPRGIIDNLTVGDILIVKLVDEMLFAYYGEEIVGAIEIPEQNVLVRCIKSGTVYIATILSIEGKICKVKITPLQ